MKPDAYLDYHATTPVDSRVLDAMWPYFAEQFGNPASRSHAAGRDASHAVEQTRAQVGRFIGAPADTITFTGGATESNNLALKGLLRGSPASRASHAARIVTIVTEHHSVLATCDAPDRSSTIWRFRRARPVGLGRVRRRTCCRRSAFLTISRVRPFDSVLGDGRHPRRSIMQWNV